MNPRNRRSLEWWVLMGMAPALLYLLVMFLMFVGGSALDFLSGYAMAMPAFALGWLLVLTKKDSVIELDQGPSMSRSRYVLGWFGVSFALWLFFAILYASSFQFH